MIFSFGSRGTQDIFEGRDTGAARKTCPPSTWKVAGRKLDLLDSAVELGDLAAVPGNRLELLRGDRKGEYSIRVNGRYRVCFRWVDGGPCGVEIVDYH